MKFKIIHTSCQCYWDRIICGCNSSHNDGTGTSWAVGLSSRLVLAGTVITVGHMDTIYIIECCYLEFWYVNLSLMYIQHLHNSMCLVQAQELHALPHYSVHVGMHGYLYYLPWQIWCTTFLCILAYA